MDFLKLNFVQRLILNGILAAMAGTLRALPEQYVFAYLRKLYLAFGPKQHGLLRHWSELSSDEQAEKLRTIPILRTTHTDWIKPFQWVPRVWVVWFGPAPEFDDVIDGNLTSSNQFKPIPDKGLNYVIDGYLTFTTDDGIHHRLGWRRDDVDNYTELSLALKKY